MNEPEESPFGEAVRAAKTTSISAGLLLRNAREISGLEISALAAILKVPDNKIEALETDRFEALPDLMFARGLASSVCRTLQIEPGPVLALMPSSFTPVIKTDEYGINAPFKALRETSGVISWRLFFTPMVLSVVVLLAGALVLLLPVVSPTTEGDDAAMSSVDEASQARPNAVVPEDSVALVSDVVAPFAESAASDIFPSGVVRVMDAASITSSASLASEASAPMVEGAGMDTGFLVLTAKEVSWVQVVDAAGVVQVRKTLRAGDVVGISGVPPLSVVLGRADAVDVQVKGEPFNVKVRTKENIARFEVM